eukprot:scaffold461_cov321-Pavlova_lutheri.AAC.35
MYSYGKYTSNPSKLNFIVHESVVVAHHTLRPPGRVSPAHPTSWEFLLHRGGGGGDGCWDGCQGTQPGWMDGWIGWMDAQGHSTGPYPWRPERNERSQRWRHPR